MARSNHIYVVMYDGGYDPMAAFTVKHEMMTWCKNNYDANHYCVRLKDGGGGDAIIIPTDENRIRDTDKEP